jgi:hypothetical protein
MDPTDVAIATFSAPGSKIYDNVHSAMSRNAGGSFDMVDGIAFYQIGAHDGYTVYDYIGTTLRNNYLDAFGARIDIGLGLGGKVWVAKNSYICKGGLVIDNVMSGDGFGYGIAINGIEDYTVTGNVSNAVHSGVGNGESVPGDPCVPFLYDPAGVFGNTKLQSGFVKNKAPVLHLLRNNRGPFIPNCPTYGGKKPFIAVCYEVPEARAVARGAYIEMLQRSPTNKELADAMAFLMDTTYEGTTPRNLNTGDMLRKNLAKTSEFVTKFGAIGTSNDAMQLYRVQLWQDEMDKRIKQSIDKNGNYPSIKAVYLNLLQTWSGDKSLQIVSPQGNTVVPVNSTVNLEWLSTGTISTVKVDYSVNGGTSWTTLSSSAPNNGAFQMQIPNIPDSDGIIRISDPTSGSTDQIAISFKKVASAISGNKRILNQLSFNIFNRQSNIIVSGKIKTLAIYNMQGKMVKEIPVHTPNITWDGITDNGTMARKGIYTVQVVSDIERVNFKIVFWK